MDAVKSSLASMLQEALAASKRAFLFVLFFSIGVNILMLTAPLYMLQVFDRVIISRSAETLIFLTLIAGTALLVLGALDAVRSFILVRVGCWLERRLGGAALIGSIAAALRGQGESNVQGLRDLMTLRTFLSSSAILPLLDAPWVPVFLLVVFLVHPWLGFLALVGTLFLFAMALANELTTRKALEQAGGRSIHALQQAEAAVRNADVIESMGLRANLIQRWYKHSSEATELQAKAACRSALITSFSKAIRFGLQVGILGLGAYLVIQGEITAGAMIAASILMGRALAPVEQSIGGWRTAVAARSAHRRLKALLSATAASGQEMPLPAPEGIVQAEGVTYIYPEATEPMLSGISFQLAAGEVMGLVGPSAAGKTTLARLLVGNLRGRVGHVRLDGMDIAKWDSGDRGQYLGYLPQDVELFGGTVRENIARMGAGEPEAVIAAAQAAGVHELVLRLPSGYESEIGPGGAKLSGGQRQRIALARAVYGNPKFVVLDEPGASLDQPGEQALVHAIQHLKQAGTTVVMITHQPRMLHLVDKVMVLAEGQIQHFGTKEEVLPKIMNIPKGQRVVGMNE